MFKTILILIVTMIVVMICGVAYGYLYEKYKRKNK